MTLEAGGGVRDGGFGRSIQEGVWAFFLAGGGSSGGVTGAASRAAAWRHGAGGGPFHGGVSLPCATSDTEASKASMSKLMGSTAVPTVC